MKSLFKIASESGRTATTTRSDELSYHTYKHGEKARSASFVIGEKILTQMRWIDGDRVDVLYDSDMAEGQLVRTKQGGWALSVRKDGGNGRVSITVRPEFGLPIVEARVDLAYELTQSTIAFAFPISYRKPLTVAPAAVKK